MTLEGIEIKNPGVTVETQSAIEIPRDKRGRIRWVVIEASGSLLQCIQSEARAFHEQFGGINHTLLSQNQRKDLATAITRKYPGGIQQLRNDIGLESSRKLHYWTHDVVERETREFVDQNGTVTHSLLESQGRSDLRTAITRHYPGGIKKVKEGLNVPEAKRPSRWNLEAVRQQAWEIYQQEGDINQKLLVRLSKRGLDKAIRKYYPGGMRQLQSDFGLESSTPKDHWTTEQIEQGGRAFLDENGDLTTSLLREHQNSGLAAAIAKRYPGGMRALKEKLGVEVTTRPFAYWKDPNIIETEALKLIATGNPLTQGALHEVDASSLIRAAQLYYPGGLSGLQRNLGIEDGYLPNGYWSTEVVEAQAVQFIEENGDISNSLLKNRGGTKLLSAIYDNYPGGMAGLKEKLGLPTTNLPVSSDQANEELSKLLEEEI